MEFPTEEINNLTTGLVKKLLLEKGLLYASLPVELDDLVQEGVLEALKIWRSGKWVPEKGAAFTSYCYQAIVWRLLTVLRGQGWLGWSPMMRQKIRVHALPRVKRSVSEGIGGDGLSEVQVFDRPHARDTWSMEGEDSLRILPRKCREILRRWGLGESQTKIAADLGVTKSCVNGQLKEGLRRLKDDYS